MEKLSEKSYVNKTAITGHSIISAVLVAAYLAELLKGARTIGYLTVFMVLCLGPVAAELLLYSKNKESMSIRYVMGLGYGVLYIFAIFTTNSILTYTYMFPLFMVLILYMDTKCCVAVFLETLLGNVVCVAYIASTSGYAKTEIPDVEIRIASTILTGAFMIFSEMAVQKVNGEKLAKIKEQADATEKMTTSILQTSQGMIEEISSVTDKMQMMGDSMDRMHNSMGEVSTGSAETAESVQKQLVRTEQIQNHIGKVKETAEQIEADMRETAGKVSDGRERMTVLAEQVDKSMTANRQVQNQMDILEEYTGQMNTIIETITSIANSTGMLALNASIEAARAGESGRGFAVVASQISGLANQTKTATVNITELIQHINSNLESVKQAVEVVTDSNRKNTEDVGLVSEKFTGIMEGTDSVGKRAEELLQIVKELEVANRDIVENIQTISAITEEVSAHANETYEACEGNGRLVEEISGIVAELNGHATELQQEN